MIKDDISFATQIENSQFNKSNQNLKVINTNTTIDHSLSNSKRDMIAESYFNFESYISYDQVKNTNKQSKNEIKLNKLLKDIDVLVNEKSSFEINNTKRNNTGKSPYNNRFKKRDTSDLMKNNFNK